MPCHNVYNMQWPYVTRYTNAEAVCYNVNNMQWPYVIRYTNAEAVCYNVNMQRLHVIMYTTCNDIFLFGNYKMTVKPCY